MKITGTNTSPAFHIHRLALRKVNAGKLLLLLVFMLISISLQVLTLRLIQC